MNKNLSIMLSALNNAVGYPMGENIEAEVGYHKTDLNSLYQKLLSDRGYELKEEERKMIQNSLKVCIKYIDDWEFPATFDFDKKDVQEFYENFS